jgi:hypothetical protein
MHGVPVLDHKEPCQICKYNWDDPHQEYHAIKHFEHLVDEETTLERQQWTE